MDHFVRNSLVFMTVKDHKYNRKKQLINRTLVTHTPLNLGDGTFYYEPTGNHLFSNIEIIDGAVNGAAHIAVGSQMALVSCLSKISSSINKYSTLTRGVGINTPSGSFSCVFPCLPELKDIDPNYYKPIVLQLWQPLNCEITPLKPSILKKQAKSENIISGIDGVPLESFNDVFNNPILKDHRENGEIAIWLNDELVFSNVEFFNAGIRPANDYNFKPEFQSAASKPKSPYLNMPPLTGIGFF